MAASFVRCCDSLRLETDQTRGASASGHVQWRGHTHCSPAHIAANVSENYDVAIIHKFILAGVVARVGRVLA